LVLNSTVAQNAGLESYSWIDDSGRFFRMVFNVSLQLSFQQNETMGNFLTLILFILDEYVIVPTSDNLEAIYVPIGNLQIVSYDHNHYFRSNGTNYTSYEPYLTTALSFQSNIQCANSTCTATTAILVRKESKLIQYIYEETVSLLIARILGDVGGIYGLIIPLFTLIFLWIQRFWWIDSETEEEFTCGIWRQKTPKAYLYHMHDDFQDNLLEYDRRKC